MTVRELIISKLEKMEPDLRVIMWDNNNENHFLVRDVMLEGKENALYDSTDSPWDKDFGFMKPGEKAVTLKG